MDSTVASRNDTKSRMVETILDGMTVTEMIAQLAQIPWTVLLEPDPSHPDTMLVNQTALDYFIGTLGVGSIYTTANDGPFGSARAYRTLRLQIDACATRFHRPPVLWRFHTMAHTMIQNATLTPQPLNLAATWNRTVVYQAGRLVSRTARAAGVQGLDAPSYMIPMESKQSLVYDTWGEDSFLSGEFSVHMVQGIQATGVANATVPSRAAACASLHVVGHSNPSGLSNRYVYQYLVHPWQRVVDAGVLTILERVTDGVSGTALNSLWRQRLGYTGVVLADGNTVESLNRWQLSAVDALAQSSVDVSMVPHDAVPFIQSLSDGVQTKVLSEDRIRESARRVLQLKNQLQMWDEVVTMENSDLDLVGTDEAEVLHMVHQSIILTKNDESILPLPTTALNVLVTGPTANSLVYQTGGPSRDDGWFRYGSTVAQAMTRQGTLWNVTYTCGTDIDGDDCNDVATTDDATQSSLDQAVALAQSSDVVLVCVGESAYTETDGDDIRTLELPDGQYALVNAIATAPTKATIVLVYFGGRPRLLKRMVDQAHAVLVAFLPGPSAGDALVDIVSGRVNPSARLPMTYPLFDDVVPYYHAVSDPCGSGACTVQWPFGHGLSYTTFVYSDVTVTAPTTDTDETMVHVSVVVTNTGLTPGADAVLVFTFDEHRTTTPEYKRLRQFDKVFLQPGEAQVVEMIIPLDDFKFVGPHDDHHSILDPSLTFWVGVGASTDCRVPTNETERLCVYTSIQNLTMPTPETNDAPYCAACEAACDVWVHQSSCGSEVGLSMNACLNMCTAVNNFPAGASDLVKEGWGWNYVNCLEAVVTGIKHVSSSSPHAHFGDSVSSSSQCWKMTMMCRDIFSTENLDEYGLGPHAPMENAHGQAPFSYALALLAAVVSTLLMIHAMYGNLPGESGTSQPAWRRRWTERMDNESNDNLDRTLYRRIEEENEEEEDDPLSQND